MNLQINNNKTFKDFNLKLKPNTSIYDKFYYMICTAMVCNGNFRFEADFWSEL